MATFKPVLNNKPKKDGTHTIIIRITEGRKHKYLALPYSVKPLEWNEAGGKDGNYRYVRTKNPLHKLINNEIETKIAEAKSKASGLEVVTPGNIKKALKGEDPKSFIQFAETHIENLKANINAHATYKKYKTVIKKLKEYLKDEDLKFLDITPSFLKFYEAHLFKLGNNTNTVHSNLKGIRAIYYQAINDDIIGQEKNPFFKFKLKTEKSFKDRLIQDEILLLENCTPEKGTMLWHTKNCFLFSFQNHGIRIGDIIVLKWENIQGDRLIYQMGKTSTIKNIKLTDKAKKILAYYKKDSKPTDFIFPLLDSTLDYSDKIYLFNQMASKAAILNKNLKALSRLAKIKKNLTFHLSRHSFASIARDKTKDMAGLQKALGHSSLSITERYLSTLSDESQDEFSDKVWK